MLAVLLYWFGAFQKTGGFRRQNCFMFTWNLVQNLMGLILIPKSDRQEVAKNYLKEN